jgi:hypothetical protein
MNYPAASSGVSSGKDLSAASGGVLTPVLRNKILVFSLFTGNISFNFKKYRLEKCNNCDKKLD